MPYLCFKNKLVFWSLWIRVFLFPLNFVLMQAAIWFHCSLKNGESNFPVRVWDGRVASDTLNVVSWQLHNISWQHVVVSRFYIIYCQSKTVHRRFSFPRVAFLRRLCRPLLDISGRSAKQTFSVQWLLHSVDRFLNEFWFLFQWIRGAPALWKF